MKRVSVGLLGAVMGLALLVAPVSTASAQFAPWSVSIFGGGVFPTGDIGDAVNTGWLVGANGDFRFSEGRSPVSVRVDIAYGSSTFKDDPNLTTQLDLKLNNLYAFAYALLHPNIGQAEDRATVDIYVGGGGGFVNSKLGGSDAPSGISSETDGALSGIVGGAAPIGGVYLFFEGRWVLIFSEGTSQNLFPVVAGLKIPFGG